MEEMQERPGFNVDPPKDMCCPITQQLMQEPVILIARWALGARAMGSGELLAAAHKHYTCAHPCTATCDVA